LLLRRSNCSASLFVGERIAKSVKLRQIAGKTAVTNHLKQAHKATLIGGDIHGW